MTFCRLFTSMITGGWLLFLTNGLALASPLEDHSHSIEIEQSIEFANDMPSEVEYPWDLIFSGDNEWGQWARLGDEITIPETQSASSFSLISDRMGHPILTFSTRDETSRQTQSHVLRWNDGLMTWDNIGEPFEASGPAIGIDNRQRIYLCAATSDGGPHVWRWDGWEWIKLGGHISEEAGYKDQRRGYFSGGCGGIALDNTNNPIVTWTASAYKRQNLTFAARWDEGLQQWVGLGGVIGSRTGGSYVTSIDIDKKNRPYLAKFGRGTSSFWHWDGEVWTQLGSPMLDTYDPRIVVNKNKPYIVFSERFSKIIKLMRWKKNKWVELSSPGTGRNPELDFSQAGKPLIAYVSLDDPNNQFDKRIRVKQFSHGIWQQLGDPLAHIPSVDNKILYFRAISLTVDTWGRPSVFWGGDINPGRFFLERYQYMD